MEDLAVIIDGTRFRRWLSVAVTHSVDTFSTITLRAPFEPDRQEFRETFRPFSFKPLRVMVSGRLLFSGTLVGVSPTMGPERREVEVTGYALPGVLQDCCAPGKTVPHEYNKMSFRGIAESIVAPFGIKLVMRAPEGTPFKRVKLKEGQVLFDFLTDLAKQRNFVLSNTPEGALLVWKSVDAGDPVAVLVEGQAPVSSVSAEFRPQEYYSEITGFASSRRGRKGSKHTEFNPWLKRLRPHSFKLDDTEKGDAPEETRAKIGRMFANVANFTLENLPGWRTPKDELWSPNTTIKLTAPSVMIYRRTEFLIRTVTLEQDAEKETAKLELVLPGAFSGETPPPTSFLPWDEPV